MAPKPEIVVEPPKPPVSESGPPDPPDPDDPAKTRTHDWRPPGEPGAPQPRPHDWRAPTPDEPPGRPRRRAAVWRPADPPVLVEVFDERERRAYAERRQTLARLLADASAAPAALLAALQSLLASPLLEEMARRDEAERWVASLIGGNAPRSDPLVDAAIAYFGWDEQRVGPRSQVGARALARREDLRFLQATRSVGNPHQGALAALTRKPVGLGLAANRLTPGLAARVRGLLLVVRTERPGLLASLDAGAAAWWDRYLDHPRLGAASIWTLILAPTVLALLASLGETANHTLDDRPLILAGAGLVAVAAVVLFNLYAIQWPRALWRRRWAASAPAWVAVGWAPALVSIVLLSAAAPASQAAALSVAGLAVVAMLWAMAVGEPDRRVVGQPTPQFRWRGPIITFPFAFAVFLVYWGALRPGVRFSWQTRSIFAFTYLAAFWFAAYDELGADVAAQMTGPLIAAAVSFIVGAGSLAGWWAARSERARTGGLVGLAGLVLAALGALWLGREITAARPIAAALIAAAVLLHKAPATRLVGPAATARDLLMRLAWIPLYLFAADVRPWAPVILFYAVLFSPGIVIVAIRQFARARPGRRMAAVADVGRAAVRYGWLAAAPVLLVVLSAPRTAALLAGGLWLLVGVAATITGLAPQARAPARPRG